MGSISYDGLVVGVDDRTLTHLQNVIVNKLRRGEAFLMSWKDSAEVGSGRSAIWMHPQVLIYFKFDGSRVPDINERWLRELAESAESSRGLVVTTEAGEVPSLVPRKYSVPRETIIAAGEAVRRDVATARTRASAELSS